MIKNLKHKGLKNFWGKNQTKGLHPNQIKRVTMLLNALDIARKPEDLNFPGTKFHALIGDRKGQYAVSVSSNLRMVFEWDNQHAINIDLIDYH